MKLNPVFDKYFDGEQALYYEQLFLENNLHPFVDKPKDEFNAAIGNSNNDLQFVLRLPTEEFEPAVNVIEKEIRKVGIPNDHHLKNSSISELQEILAYSDEWSREDVIAAKILLEEQDVHVDYKQIEKVKSLIRQTKKDREGIISPLALILLYLSALLGGLIAIAGGAFIYFSKSSNLDGQIEYTFTEPYRTHGKNAATIGARVATCFIIARIMFPN